MAHINVSRHDHITQDGHKCTTARVTHAIIYDLYTFTQHSEIVMHCY